MKPKTIVVVAALALAATGTFAATKLPSGNIDSADPPPRAPGHNAAVKPVNVETRSVDATTTVEYVNARGVTRAKTDITFSAEIPGRLLYAGAEPGEAVGAGQVLAKIDLNSLRAQRDRIQAGYDLANVTHTRLSTLGSQAVTGQKLDEAKYTKSEARAQLAAIEADLDKGVVRSTLTGVVTAKHVERSEFVTPGTPLFRVVDYRNIVIDAQLAETQVSQVRAGSVVDVTIDALGQTFKGRVAAVLPAADRQARTFTARVEVDNSNRVILVGMSARLAIPARVHENVVVVSQDSVLETQDGRGVFVAIDGTARYRPVTLGAATDDRVIVLSGLQPGDDLVVLGHRYLDDGHPVRIAMLAENPKDGEQP